MGLIEYIESKREENLNELKEFLRIPSVSAKSEHKPDIEKAASWVAEKLRCGRPGKYSNHADENASAGVRRVIARSWQADNSFLWPL